MLKYHDTAIVFAEIPEEITLAIEITNCPHHCHNCHSPWLQTDIGTELNSKSISQLITDNPDITCICFMGGDSDHNYVSFLADMIHLNTQIKVGMYSGDDDLDDRLVKSLDYYKIGHYDEKRGPLNNKNTNQKLYRIVNNELQDITYKF